MNVNSFLNENSIWIMYNSENCDPYFSKFITNKTIVPAIAAVTFQKTYLIVHSLDYSNVSGFAGEIIMYDGENSLVSNLCKIIENSKYPAKIYLNYSDKMDSQTDVLGYGTFRFLHDNIKHYYTTKGKSEPEFLPADEFIYALTDSKSDEDLKCLRIAAGRAQEILNMAFKKIKPGMSERNIVETVHQIFRLKPGYFQKHKIMNEEFSWEKEMCPIVLVGANLEKGGHTRAGNTVLQRGDTVYFDFGVKLTFSNGKKYSSDIQRMGYVLKKAENTAPKSVQKVFDTLKDAIRLGAQNLKPNVRGFEIDKIVRNHIVSSGYPDYNHATGHPVGESAHSPGTSLSPKGHKRSSLFLQENGVYTIEPRIQIKNGGSVEEMFAVTKNGGTPLCTPQEKLYLIK